MIFLVASRVVVPAHTTCESVTFALIVAPSSVASLPYAYICATVIRHATSSSFDIAALLRGVCVCVHVFVIVFVSASVG